MEQNTPPLRVHSIGIRVFSTEPTTMDVLDVVVLTRDVPERNLAAGARGTIVMVLDGPTPHDEVEFCDEDGSTIAELVLAREQIKPSPQDA